MSTEFSLAQYPTLLASGQGTNGTRGEVRGHAAGYAAGLRAAAEDTEALRATLRAEHDRLEQARQTQVEAAIAVLTAATRALNAVALPVVADSEDVLVSSALELAEAVIGHELRDAEGSARAALARVTAQPISSVVPLVRMNPDDLALLADEVLAHQDFTFMPDPQLPRGDAVAELPDGFLDARIGTALQRAKLALGEQ
ncbi:MAG TPA: FliH/SctL family protein [Terrimesophilobacter sp.]|uniref:FliH/SctL family protein n=1 Tax=Terrimesophilobacter sp. TaxID=2906435 RepID=UPI002F95DC71